MRAVFVHGVTDARISQTPYISQADIIHLPWISVNGKTIVYKKRGKRSNNTSVKIRLLL